MIHPDDWMSVREVVKRTGHSRQWVHQRIQAGTFKHERNGRRIDVDGRSVSAWMLNELAYLHEKVQHLYENLPYK